MVNTVPYVTSNAIFSLFGYGVRLTATYYMKNFDMKLPKKALQQKRLQAEVFALQIYFSVLIGS